MWLMLQQAGPDDYVIATGETHTVREFLDLAFKAVDLDADDYVRLDPGLIRPAEVEILIGSPDKARRTLNWRHETTFEKLVLEMVESDQRLLSKAAM